MTTRGAGVSLYARSRPTFVFVLEETLKIVPLKTWARVRGYRKFRADEASLRPSRARLRTRIRG